MPVKPMARPIRQTIESNDNAAVIDAERTRKVRAGEHDINELAAGGAQEPVSGKACRPVSADDRS
jgi:hypothetical protein